MTTMMTTNVCDSHRRKNAGRMIAFGMHLIMNAVVCGIVTQTVVLLILNLPSLQQQSQLHCLMILFLMITQETVTVSYTK